MEQSGKWTRRMRRAMLPIGVALAILVILRVVRLITGLESAEPLDILWVLLNGPLAAYFIWAGREYRRANAPN
jgi:threonine/homoserine efflux transporter RhtA